MCAVAWYLLSKGMMCSRARATSFSRGWALSFNRPLGPPGAVCGIVVEEKNKLGVVGAAQKLLQPLVILRPDGEKPRPERAEDGFDVEFQVFRRKYEQGGLEADRYGFSRRRCYTPRSPR